MELKKEPDKSLKNILKYVFKDNNVNNDILLLKNKIFYQLTCKIQKHVANTLTNIDNGIEQLNYLLLLIKDDKCIPFWNDNIKQLSKEHFLPISKNIRKLKYPKTFTSNSWFNTEHYNSINNEKSIKINKERVYNTSNNIKTIKIKLYLSTIQKEYIKRALGVYRYFYNRTIQYINNYNKETKKTYYMINYDDNENKYIWIDLKDENSKFSFYTVRKLIKDHYPNWMNDINIPSHLIDKAINESVINYKKCLEMQMKNKKRFELKFKTRKNKLQTMNIEKEMINIEKNTIFTNTKYKNQNIFKKFKTSLSIKSFKNICDSSISHIQILDEFYLNLCYEDNKLIDQDLLNKKQVCSIDPGLASFAVCYSDNQIHKIGNKISSRISKHCKEIDILTSNIYSKNKNKSFVNNYQSRRNMKKALYRKNKKIQNLKNELHNKTVKFLTNTYGRIVIPPFETQKLVESSYSSKMSRALYNISFYTFLLKLKEKCNKKDIELIIRPEYYTSKTCTRCGSLNNKLNLSNRTFKCSKCYLVIDRDINGARNIMLRNNDWELPPLRN